MSKSLGNGYLLNDLIEKGYDPLSYKMLCFSSHYRNKLNFTWEALENAQISLNKLREGYEKHLEGTDKIEENVIEEYKTKFKEAINDDLNLPVAMSVVWEVVKNINKSKQLAEVLLDFDKVLGIDIDKKEQTDTKIPEEIKELLEKRKLARDNKDWGMSDKLRDEIEEKGYILKDTKDGMEITKKG